MSWSDKELDNIFREASNSAKAPIYQESFFDDIEKLLPKKKSKTGVYFVIGSVISISLFASLYVGFESNAQANKNVELESKSNIEANKKSIHKTNKVSSLAKTESKKTTTILKVSNSQIFKIQSSTNINSNVNTSSKSKASIINNEIKSLRRINPSTNTYQDLKSLVEDKILTERMISFIESQETNPTQEKNNKQQNFEELTKTEFTLIERIPFQELANPVFAIHENAEVSPLNLPMQLKKHLLYLDLDFGFSKSFVNTTPASKPMKTFAIGAGYQYRKKGYAIEMGVHFMNYNPTELNLTRESKVYGFTANKYTQNIDYKLISTLEVPIVFSKITRKHQFGVGIVPGLVLGSIMDFTKTENGVQTANERVYGNKLGLTQLSLKPQISYSLNLVKNIQIGAKIALNSINFLDESKFIGTTNKFPIQGQLSIRKNFNKK